MRQFIDRVFYYATAPVRLFATSRRFRLIVGGIVVVAVCFKATLWALDYFLPQDTDAKQVVAKLPQLPALQPATRSSYVIAPVAVALTAIGQRLDSAAPAEMHDPEQFDSECRR